MREPDWRGIGGAGRWSRRNWSRVFWSLWAVWGIRGNVLEHGPYGDPRRMRICETWAVVYGLRDVGLRTLRFFVNCRRATDTYGGRQRVWGRKTYENQGPGGRTRACGLGRVWVSPVPASCRVFVTDEPSTSRNSDMLPSEKRILEGRSGVCRIRSFHLLRQDKRF